MPEESEDCRSTVINDHIERLSLMVRIVVLCNGTSEWNIRFLQGTARLYVTQGIDSVWNVGFCSKTWNVTRLTEREHPPSKVQIP